MHSLWTLCYFVMYFPSQKTFELFLIFHNVSESGECQNTDDYITLTFYCSWEALTYTYFKLFLLQIKFHFLSLSPLWRWITADVLPQTLNLHNTWILLFDHFFNIRGGKWLFLYLYKVILFSSVNDFFEIHQNFSMYSTSSFSCEGGEWLENLMIVKNLVAL